VKFVEAVYGKETLEENLRFIGAALGGQGTPRQVLRNYLLSGFYADHLKIYRKRPIYWQFSSGKKNGFKALIYMHRYEPALPERMLEDYVQSQCRYYRSRLSELETATGDRMLLKKQLDRVKAQLRETEDFAEKLRTLAERRICLDPDDGVKVNYGKLQTVLEQIK
jgi:type II restriction/modification system DNA methylase subunit YeeA